MSAAALDHKTCKARLVLDLRQAGITNTKVLAAIESIPRERFVSDSLAAHAYDDSALPIECGQTISQPAVVAWMTIALQLGERMKVLEVGTGSGYQATVLSRLCRRIYTIERYRLLLRQAEARFRELDLNNIAGKLGDGSLGWPEQAPFDRIIVTAAAPEPLPALLDQLAVDGIMVLPLGGADEVQTLVRIKRDGDGYHRDKL
ncbi:MAG: protein-L-isoaspartate(D-aspartate) O-methyltransferase, partial [Alphaproteobacteria bacterium]|nr:protein-L-isoaspartate(D-aspartate) O-methyltransferase [Alphaproteobacteria bacterium]